ncbi:hypothetical protein CUN61_09920 [Pseudomonas arsenicoxydans]|uniref:Uncharacterized protein n=1 Tax=Pseudomonas arsenicoxydans TaxID=702115 RepID=A0A4P6G2H0_9PSED|nr:hypothetical protein CUN61_09920 [Pseudomonas arsenicoxydans]
MVITGLRHSCRGPVLLWAPQNQCGSEPARDGGITVSIDGECYGLIASRLTPTWGCGVFSFRVCW